MQLDISGEKHRKSAFEASLNILPKVMQPIFYPTYVSGKLRKYLFRLIRIICGMSFIIVVIISCVAISGVDAI